MSDMVNHPDHYKTKSGLETIDVIEAFTDGLNGGEATNTGNVIKYICRWKKKNGLEDLEKARWYLNRLIDLVKKKEEEDRTKNGPQGANVFCRSYNDIVFSNRGDAEEVLGRMEELLEHFKAVSVADLFDLAGLRFNYTDNNYGWTNLREARVERVCGGYTIRLPKATNIDLVNKKEEEV